MPTTNIILTAAEAKTKVLALAANKLNEKKNIYLAEISQSINIAVSNSLYYVFIPKALYNIEYQADLIALGYVITPAKSQNMDQLDGYNISWY